MNSENKHLISRFIDLIWNRQQFDQLHHFLHAEFADHSLPPSFTPDAAGLQHWITTTGTSFNHNSRIEKIAGDQQIVMIKFRMELEHVGIWRNIEPTGALIHTVGFRCFEIDKGKIRAHWALIDGNSIENQLRQTHHGCKIQQ